MVKFNSTIFRTIKDEATGANKSIGLFGKSFTELKNIINSVKTNGLFNTSIISETDVECIKKYNNAIALNIPHQQAMEQATKGASTTTAQMIKNANGNTIALNKMTIGAKAANIAMNLLSTAMNMAIMWGISKLITAWDDYKEKLKETAQEASELAEESSNYVQELKDLEKQLEDGTTSAEDLTTAFREQLRTMGYTETQIDSLIEKYGTLANSIKGATKEALTNAQTDANTAKNKAGKSLEAEYSGKWINLGANKNGISSETYDFIYKTLEDAAKRRNNSIYSGSYNEFIPKSDSAEDIYGYYKGLLDIKKKIEEEATQTKNDNLYDSIFYKDIEKMIKELEGSATLYQDSLNNLYKSNAQLEVFDYLEKNNIETQKEFDKYIESIKNNTGYIEAYREILLQVVNDTFKEFSKVNEESKDDNAILNYFDYSKHKEAIESYQKTLSAVSDTIEKIRDKSVGADGIDINKLMGMDEFKNVDKSIWNDMLTRGEVSEDDMKQIAIDAWNKIHDSLKNYSNSEAIIQELKDDFEKASFGVKIDIAVNENAYNELVGILDDIHNNKTFSHDDITTYINKYGDEIAGALTAVGDAYTIEEEAIISLINKYGEFTNAAIASEMAALSAGKARIDALGGIAKAQEIVKDIYTHSPTQQNRDYAEQLKLDIADAESYYEYYDSWKEILDKMNNLGSKSSTENTFDWIEVKINNIKEAIEELRETADDPFASWTDRGSALQSVIDKLKSSYNDYDKAYKTYLAEAENVGLGSKYKTLVQEGAFDIESFKDDPNYDKIQEYQKLYEQALEMEKLRDSVSNEVNSSIQDNFDLIISEFDTKISHFENTASMIETKLANAESRGLIATQQYYQTLHDIESGKQALLQQQLTDLTKALDGTNFETDSEGWSNLTSEIESTEIAIQESTNAMQEFNNEIRQIDWDLFDFARDQESKLMNEADFMIDLLDSAKMFSEAGEITAEGMATMGLHAQNYNAYLEQSIDYAKELASLQEIYGEDTIDANVIERRNELLELQQESILSAEAEKDAMIDLVSEGIELQKEAFQGLIDEYTEALDVQKDLYDYQKKNSEQTKKIAQIQKQLAAYQGDNSEEARAKVQQLKVQLDEEQSNLESDQYDRYISDQKEILSTISEDYNNALDAYLDDTAKVISDSIDAANRNASNIGKTLAKATNDVGYDVKYAWNDEKGVLATNFEDVEKNILSNNNVLGEIKDNNKILIEAQQNAIVGELNKLTGNESPLSHLSGIKSVLVEISTKIDGIKTGGSNDSSTSGETNIDPTPQPIGGGNTGSFGVNFTKKKSSYDKSKLNTDTSVVDLLKYHDFDSSKSARADYYSQMGFEDVYKDTPTQNLAMLEWLKRNGYKANEYASGGKNLNKQLAWTQENGNLEYIIRKSDGAILTPINPGDMVLNPEASKRLWEMTNNPTSFIMDSIRKGTTVDVPKTNSMNNNNVDVVMNAQFVLPNARTYEEMVSEMQRDRKFEGMVKDMIGSALTGSNSLSKYRHQF